MDNVTIDELIGQTITKIDLSDDKYVLKFITDKYTYEMYHSQDCCEHVWLDDVVGDWEDIIDTPVIDTSEEISYDDDLPKDKDSYTQGSQTWTFYKIQTNKGGVLLRWFGTSNGYYSESVDIVRKENART